MHSRYVLRCFTLLTALLASHVTYAEEFMLQLTQQIETYPESGRFHRVTRQERWLPENTAILVCDMWDSHHSVNAVRRVTEIAPRMNALITKLRSEGSTVIHAPSDCMAAYQEHPARLRALQIPMALETPTDISSWCDQIPSEGSVPYPLDQSDGGEDDDLREHEQWAASLAANGRKPATPWIQQTPLITIDPDNDYITDNGREVWSILANHKINHVMLIGVHTNMCVLGRPFGLRQLASHGKNVVLVRDLTDSMYNPKSWPYVNHFSGNDLIVEHIERYVCPTITSDQILDDQQFRFRDDRRKHVAILISENEYRTNETLTQLARAHLQKDFRVSIIHGPEPADNADPKQGLIGLDAIDDADVLLISVRRKPLPPDQLTKIQQYVASGKPVVGIRTANHAFLLRDDVNPEGTMGWKTLDADVFGGHYRNHYANEIATKVAVADVDLLKSFLPDESSRHELETFVSQGSLYQTAPVVAGASVFLTGSIDGKPSEPLAWTYVRADSGRSFYTSLGHPSDFESAAVSQLIVNALRWSVDLPAESAQDFASHAEKYRLGRGRQRK